MRPLSSVVLALGAGLVACWGDSGEPGPVTDPCVEQSTGGILVIDLLTSKTVMPGQIASFTFRIDARDRDGVLMSVPGEISVDGPGQVVASDGNTAWWRAGMEHGVFDVRIGRAGCPDDFILEKITVAGPRLEVLRDAGAGLAGTGVTWSPDSRSVAFAGRDELRLYDTAGRFQRGTKTGVLGILQRVAWSPDGAWIAVAGDAGLDRGPLLLKAERLLPWTRFPKDGGYGVTFGRDARELFALELERHPNAGVLASRVVSLDLESGAAWALEGAPGLATGAGGGTGEPPFDMTVDTLGVLHVGAMSHKLSNFITLRNYTCTDDDRTRVTVPDAHSGLVYVATETAVCAVNPATGDTVEVGTTGLHVAHSLALDPNGEGLVVVGKACDGGVLNVCDRSVVVYRGDLADPKGLVPTTFRQRGEATSVAWSPDGAWVAFATTDGGAAILARDALWFAFGDPFERR
jgi:WD40 repeat protein